MDTPKDEAQVRLGSTSSTSADNNNNNSMQPKHTGGRGNNDLPTSCPTDQQQQGDSYDSSLPKRHRASIKVCPETMSDDALSSVGSQGVIEENGDSSGGNPNLGILKRVFSKSRTAKWLDASKHSIAGGDIMSSIISHAPSMLDLSSSVTQPTEGLGSVALTCIIVNYISAGYILLPLAFVQVGLLIATSCLAMVSMQSYTTAIYLLESCARAEALKHAPAPGSTLGRNYSMAIRHRKFELPDLTKTFLGETWSRFFSLTTSLDLYGITWTFAVVFAQNLSEHVPILGSEGDDYKLYVGIFLALSIPLSCISILDQVWVQMGFLVARMIMVMMMIVTLVMAYSNPNEAYFESRPLGAALQSGIGGGFPTFGSLIGALQTCVFATAFQFSIPGVAHVSAERKQISWSVRCAVGFAFCSNLTVALLVAYYFGGVCEESNNLNWLGFHGRADSTGAQIVSYYVVLMAAVDGLAVYPLNAIPLGEGLMAAIHGEHVDVALAQRKWLRVFYRVLASLPQGIGALWIHDLGSLAKYAGVFTLLSYTICPAFLYIRSGKMMKERGLPTDTYYSHSFMSHPATAYTLIAASLLLIIGVVIDAARG